MFTLEGNFMLQCL